MELKTISAEEQKTFDLFSAYLMHDNWTSEGQMISTIFNAFHMMAYSREHLEKVACAQFQLANVDLSGTLTKLVKAKVLRSRVRKGIRLYEVNY